MALIKTPTRRRGFSLVEAVVSMVLVAVLMVAALDTLGASARRRLREGERDQLLPLAHGLMTEILQAHYEDSNEANRRFGAELDEVTHRADFDDVDDYHGWTSTPPESMGGLPIADETIVRTVTVELVDPGDLTGAGPTAPTIDQGLKRITVEVGRTGGAAVTVSALRARDSAYDREPSVESAYVRWVGVTLQLGEQGPPLSSGVSVLNQVATGDQP